VAVIARDHILSLGSRFTDEVAWQFEPDIALLSQGFIDPQRQV
jgi:hypothetical protein